MRLMEEVFGKILQSYIITVKAVMHGQADIGGMQLQADLAVDSGLPVLCIVLAHLRGNVTGMVGG